MTYIIYIAENIIFNGWLVAALKPRRQELITFTFISALPAARSRTTIGFHTTGSLHDDGLKGVFLLIGARAVCFSVGLYYYSEFLNKQKNVVPRIT